MRKEQKFYQLACNITKYTKGVCYNYYEGKLFGISVSNGYFKDLTYCPYYGNYIEIFDFQEFDTEYHCDKDDLDDLEKIVETIKTYFPNEQKVLLEGIDD